MEDAEIAEIAEDAPAEGPVPVPAPAPAPAATLEIVHERPHSKEQESQQRTLGDQPVHIRTLFQPGLVDTQYNVLTFCKTCKYSHFSFFALLHTCRAIIQLLSRPGIQSYKSTSFKNQ